MGGEMGMMIFMGEGGGVGWEAIPISSCSFFPCTRTAFVLSGRGGTCKAPPMGGLDGMDLTFVGELELVGGMA
jgi:hypothetical protein